MVQHKSKFNINWYISIKHTFTEIFKIINTSNFCSNKFLNSVACFAKTGLICYVLEQDVAGWYLQLGIIAPILRVMIIPLRTLRLS